MLVLTRKLQEQIRIGDQVVITILQIRGQSVRVGIQAPRNVRVLRAELEANEPEAPSQTVTTVELKPGEQPAVKTSPVKPAGAKRDNAKCQPLAGRLHARRTTNTGSNASTPLPDQLGGAMLALALA